MTIRRFCKLALALAILAMPVLAEAHPDHRGGPRLIERSVELDLKIRNERLPVRRILELGPSFDGKRLRAVEVNIKPRGRNTRFILLGDGHVIGEAWSGRYDSFVSIRPYNRVKLGRDFKRLQLAVEGSARIERLSARFREGKERSWRGGHNKPWDKIEHGHEVYNPPRWYIRK